MIGTNIRSVRHLMRVSDASFKNLLVQFKENAWDFCKVIKTPKESPFGETLFVFNNYIKQAHWSFDTIASSKDLQKAVKEENIIGRYCRVMSISPSEADSFSNFFHEIILLPKSFESDYEKFIKENTKMVSNLMSKYGMSTNDTKVKMLYMYSDGSKNFFQWAVTSYFQNHVSMSTIKDILIWNETYKQLAKNLSKGSITAYTSRESIPLLLEELRELRKEKRINDSINSFNTTQKKLLKNNELNDDVKQALWRLSRLSETKRINFIKKMSSVEDFGELARQLRFVTSVHFSWSKESFMDFIANVEGIKYEKIFENDNIVLVKVLDYETVKQLGKTTNWCISKNKQYWNNYIENYHGQTTQYMVFDFSKVEDDKLSIIGFTTTRNKGITSAHNFINEPLIGEHQEGERVLLNSFISRFKNNKNIYSILADDGVDITLVVHYDVLPYAWDKEHLMNYLFECVDKHNVEVLVDKDDKLALSVTDENIRYFFGDAYHDNIGQSSYNQQHIIFADFSKNKYDTDKLQFAIIEESCGDEDYCNSVYDERSQTANVNFDSKLIEFGLPYNTIRRTNNIRVRLRDAISSYNTPMIMDCLNNCPSPKDMLRRVLKEDYGSDSIFDMFMRTVRSYVSFDYLNLLYDNGMCLKDFMSYSYIGDMIKQFAYDMKAISRATTKFTKLEKVTDEDIELFFNREVDSREDAKYIGIFAAIKKILSNERFENASRYNETIGRFVNFILGEARTGEIYEQILFLVLDHINFTRTSECAINIVKYAAYNGSEELRKFVERVGEKDEYFKKAYDDYNAQYMKYAKLSKKGPETVTVTINNGAADFAYAFDDAPHF